MRCNSFVEYCGVLLLKGGLGVAPMSLCAILFFICIMDLCICCKKRMKILTFGKLMRCDYIYIIV